MKNQENILGWDEELKIWHIMVKSQYIENQAHTTIASCQYKKDKKRGKYQSGLHRDWIDGPVAQFPDGLNFHNGLYPPISLNFNMICSKCLKKEISNIKEFKQWLIIQKLKYL